ncbi:exosortase B [Niveibacterium sp. SC-1]|uniref:exosortase B n=1 Tax=Niveibacterium sp. SC-1 TaxID=3135646 RepID=UPI00311DA78F
MSGHPPATPAPGAVTPRPDVLLAVPILIGMVVLYVPTVVSLFQDIWLSDEQGHGPIVLGLVIWLFHRAWPKIYAARSGGADSGVLWGVFALSLCAYALGRSQGIDLLEVGSAIGVTAALFGLVWGWSSLRSAIFPLCFMFFLVPLPGAIVDAVTMPMKIAVSNVVEWGLHGLGYPIGRSGVVLQIGSYSLLVADACAGLHTLFTLEALGLLYLNLVRHHSRLRNVFVGVLGIPIAFVANVTRVAVLVLLTYYFGDGVGQGFLHGFAGFLLFGTALLLLLAVDTGIRRLLPRTEQESDA